MRGHLGAQVSALVDGQLSPAEAEEAWDHVYGCHLCRDLVEREGWVKTRLAGTGEYGVPESLKGSLLNLTPGECYLSAARPRGRRVSLAVAVAGGGAVGVALLGFVALGMAPGPGAGARVPASQIGNAVPTNASAPVTGPGSRRGSDLGSAVGAGLDGAQVSQVIVHRLP